MKIIGIDQGYANLGYSMIEVDEDDDSIRRIYGGTLRTKPDKPYVARLDYLYDKLDSFIGAMVKEHEVDLICIEQIRGIVAGIREVSGILFHLASKHNVPIVEIGVGTVKKHITGNGKASKDMVLKGLKELEINDYNYKGTDHENDSIAIAWTGYNRIQVPKSREQETVRKQYNYYKSKK